jgi:hypothetical protein
MKRFFICTLSLLVATAAFSQNDDRDKIYFKEYQPGYFQNTILRDVNESPLMAKPKESLNL